MSRFCSNVSFAFLSLVLSVSGCSNSGIQLGKVNGKITLDGKALAGVIINFKPDDGRAATGTTDADGNYTLEYSYGEMGAKVGPNTVMLEWPLEGGEVGAGSQRKALPPRYTGLNSELKCVVEKGKNTLNFDLTSSKK